MIELIKLYSMGWINTTELIEALQQNDRAQYEKGYADAKQAAMEVIDAVFPVDAMKSEYAQGIACGAALAKSYVEQLPSAQPEIIRCGQCKYAEVADKEDRQDGYTCQFHRGSIWFSGSYCSWAERREDE